MQPNTCLYYLETNIHMSEGVQFLKKKSTEFCSSQKIKWKIRLIADVRYKVIIEKSQSGRFMEQELRFGLDLVRMANFPAFIASKFSDL